MKKTEEELRQEIQEEYNFDEGDERIDSILEIKKDRYTATQAKKKAKDDLALMEKGKNFYKKKSDPNMGKQAKKANEGENPNYSIQDIRALNKVEDEDVDKVTKYAKKFHDGSPSEALKDEDLQAILKNRKEVRKTAEAANVGSGSKRGASKVSGADLLHKAKTKGEMPEDDASIDKLLEEKYKTAS